MIKYTSSTWKKPIGTSDRYQIFKILIISENIYQLILLNYSHLPLSEFDTFLASNGDAFIS